MPLDVMVEYMQQRYEAGDMPTAHMAARDCAPYLHPRLSAAEVKVQQKPADQDEETSKRLAIEAFIQAFGPRKLTVSSETLTSETLTVQAEAVLTDAEPVKTANALATGAVERETYVNSEPEHIENGTGR